MLVDYLREGAKNTFDTGKPFVAMSVGCGPAFEMQQFLEQERISANCILGLLDFNGETLGYARKKILDAAAVSGNRPEISFFHESVHSLLKSAVKPNAERPYRDLDFVYCAGLFDYLSDRVCSRLIRLFYSWLAPGGIVLVTNMHVHNPHRYLLEHGAEWYLIHRDEAQMLRLIPGVGMQRTYTDDTGINLCLEVKKVDGATVARH
jgi:extracellular factor (EF) 3-hydroxypalmitic acid methyl ester biosynthesis protein